MRTIRALSKEQYIEAVVDATVSITATATYIDASPAITIGAGEWLIGYNASVRIVEIGTPGSGTEVTGQISIRDSDNNRVANTSKLFTNLVHPTQDIRNRSELSCQKKISVASTKTYKLSARTANANASFQIMAGNQSLFSGDSDETNSILWAKKLE